MNVVLWRIFFKLFDLKNLLINSDVDFLSLSVKSTFNNDMFNLHPPDMIYTQMQSCIYFDSEFFVTYFLTYKQF